MFKHFVHFLTAVPVVFAIAISCSAQVPDYDFLWATITDANYPAYPGDKSAKAGQAFV